MLQAAIPSVRAIDAAVRRNGFALLILFISDFVAGWMQNLCIE